MMKILVITHENTLSGANKSLLALIDLLSDRVEFDVVFNNPNGELSESLSKIPNVRLLFSKYNWSVAHSRSTTFKRFLRRGVDGFKYYSTYRISTSWLETLEQNNYDLVYSNTSTIDIGFRISKKLRIPHVWHIREFGKSDFNFQNLRSQSYYKKMYRESAAIVFISKALQQEYEKEDKYNSRVIYNGFNVSKLKSKRDIKKRLKDHVVNIAITGQVSPGKGQDQAIKACGLLNKRGYNIILNVFGEVDYDYLKQTVPEFGKYKWLKLHGQVLNIYEFRDKMDLELVCSKKEAFGRVTIEAMLHKLPIIGSDSGGTAELIVNYKTGLLYNNGEINELACSIAKLIDNDDLRISIIKEAEKYAEQFTIEKTANSLYELFKEVVSGEFV